MSLLDTNALQSLFGSVLSGVYGSGRLIRVTKIRALGGVMINRYEEPIPIKIQVDRCDEEMRGQSGYTSENAKLLILQAGVGSPAPTSDDVIEVRGDRWNIFSVGEDPARSYWRGRGVKQSPTQTKGWVFEFGHWDDAGVWSSAHPWSPVEIPPMLLPIDNWDSVEVAQAKIIGLLQARGGDIDSLSWADVAIQLSGFLDEPILTGDSASVVRVLINELIEETI